MSYLGDFAVKSNSSIRFAMELINKNAVQICFIVDDNNKLIGALSDGDIRRALLNGANLDSNVSDFMNKQPKYLTTEHSFHDMALKMKQWDVKQLPVLDKQHKLVRVEIFDELLGVIKRPYRVVLMAGGLGVRLRPLTDNIQKPLLPIAGTPILERIISRFHEAGFSKFTICVNYLAEQIKNHFLDGKKFGVDIEYITESKEMGTCGSLSLLCAESQEPIIVMNGDILTSANFSELMTFHNSKNSLATMCVKEYVVDIPYGTVKLNDQKVESITEKPKEIFHISAGIYVLSQEALKLIPKDTRYDMPALFTKLGEMNITTHAYILRDYWLDIGRIEDYHKAQYSYEDNSRKLPNE
ncbi:MAG: nucleotidyltransferase family protein [Bdellovibrionota bacterium]